MKIKINKLQNEKTAKEYGVLPTDPGTVMDLPETGTNLVYLDRYELFFTDGKRVNEEFPVGYGENEDGNKYLLYATSKGIGAFRTVKKY